MEEDRNETQSQDGLHIMADLASQEMREEESQAQQMNTEVSTDTNQSEEASVPNAADELLGPQITEPEIRIRKRYRIQADESVNNANDSDNRQSKNDEQSNAPKDSIVSEAFNVKVVNQRGETVYFKVRPQTLFSKLFRAYCDRGGYQINQLRFLFDGVRLNGNDTPGNLDMEDGDVIDCVAFQTGG